MAQTWAKFIWQEHKLVSFPGLDPEHLNLLDVLVKEDSYGIPWLGGGPVLVRIGDIFSLGAPPPTVYSDAADAELDSDDDGAYADDEAPVVDVETLQKELGLLRSTVFPRPQLKHLRQIHLGDWSAKLDSSSGFLATACGLARASLRGDRAQSCSIQNIKAERVNTDHLADLFAAKAPGWIPNVEVIQKRRRSRSNFSEELELWIVTKIVYARSIVFGHRMSHSAGITVHLPASEAGPVSLDGHSETVDYVEVAAPTGAGQLCLGIPVGYQAMRVKYNKGEASLRMDMGKSRPVTRVHEQEEPTGPEGQPEYHMSDLMDSNTSHSLPLVSLESYSPFL